MQRYLPDSEQYYPAECLSDQKDEFVFQEIIRSEILMHTREEIPHHVLVVCDSKRCNTKTRLSLFFTLR